MKVLKFLYYPILSVLFCLIFTGCEIDNYGAPDCTIEGKFTDHQGQAFQVNHGAGIIRIRELSWAKDEDTYIANQTLYVQQDGSYRNTKMFKGTYRMLPYAGAFFPYDDANRDGDAAGDLVEIKGTVKKDFSVTPYLTIEWVKKPSVDANGYLSCSVRFTRNQKGTYAMPDLRRANLQISRTVNAGAADTSLFPTQTNISNAQEGTEIELKTVIPLRWTGINYWIRVAIEVQSNSSANYQGLPASNYTTVEQIFVP